MTVTTEELKQWAASKQSLLDQRPYPQTAAYALGLATMSGDTCIEVKYFPCAVNVGTENELTLAIIVSKLIDLRRFPDLHGATIFLDSKEIKEILAEYPPELVQSATPKEHGNVWALKQMLRASGLDGRSDLMDRMRVPVLRISFDLMAPPTVLEEVYLRLMTQSLCKTMPLETSSVIPKEAFGLLHNVVWTSRGVFTLDEYDQVAGEMLGAGLGDLPVILQDKLPRMVDYVRPEGVRIVDPNRVRLGARLAPGTTVMPEGAANFNAVTLGVSMVEGRITAGVTVGAYTDIGGGVSTLGTMSGGNSVRVSIGEYCLLEAESVLGIPIGDRVRVEVGLAIKSTTPVTFGHYEGWSALQTNPHVAAVLERVDGPYVKALELAGISDAIFRRNARTGAVEVIPRGDRIWGELNPVLHKN